MKIPPKFGPNLTTTKLTENETKIMQQINAVIMKKIITITVTILNHEN